MWWQHETPTLETCDVLAAWNTDSGNVSDDLAAWNIDSGNVSDGFAALWGRQRWVRSMQLRLRKRQWRVGCMEHRLGERPWWVGSKERRLYERQWRLGSMEYRLWTIFWSVKTPLLLFSLFLSWTYNTQFISSLVHTIVNNLHKCDWNSVDNNCCCRNSSTSQLHRQTVPYRKVIYLQCGVHGNIGICLKRQ